MLCRKQELQHKRKAEGISSMVRGHTAEYWASSSAWIGGGLWKEELCEACGGQEKTLIDCLKGFCREFYSYGRKFRDELVIGK